MKTLVFSNADDSRILEFTVDLIGSAESCTIYQVKQTVDGTTSILKGFGGSEDLNSTLITAGFGEYADPKNMDNYDLGSFVSLADSANYKLVVKETGESDVVKHTIS